MNQRFQPAWKGGAQRTYNYEPKASKQLSPKMLLQLCEDKDAPSLSCLDLRKYYVPAEGGLSSTHKGIYLDIETWRWVRDELNILLAKYDEDNPK